MRLKIFSLSLILSLPIWWGINILAGGLEETFYNLKIAVDPEILTADISYQFIEAKTRNRIPQKNLNFEAPDIEAKSALSFWVDPKNKLSLELFEKNSDENLPIASLTKLFSSHVVLEYYDIDQEIIIDNAAASQPGITAGNLKPGEKFYIRDLLYLMLMESDNSAAYAISEALDKNGLVELMNLENKKLNLKNTSFVNPTGLDEPRDLNLSTARDLIKFIEYLLGKDPLLWKIISASEFNLSTSDGVFHHKVINTNELLQNSETGWRGRIIGGKTGETPKSGGCLLLVLREPESGGYIISVILGSDDRFGEMRKLIDWVYESYDWR